MTKQRPIVIVACAVGVACLANINFALADGETPIDATVSVNAGKVLRTMDAQRLGGTNVALWYEPSVYDLPAVQKWVQDMHGRYIRIPGGSWSNMVYWNGNGVRGTDGKVDPSKVGPDGFPAVDYSGYAPSFVADPKTLHPSSGGWHGNVDVKKQQDFIKAISGTQALACPNAGTGRPIDAAEWVKWANKKMGYNVRYWEIGNELGGSWEPGNDLPFGKGQITAAMYTKRYNDMAAAMRKEDPTIKIGSCPFVEDALRDCGSNVDFVSIHTYPGSTTLSDDQMFSDIAKLVESEVTPVKTWIHKYQPQREKQIEIAYSEWNLGGGLDTSETFSGLWSSIFLGEIAKNGVSFATEWDCFTDILGGPEDSYARKSEYYALWLWNNYMGNRLIPAASSNRSIYTFASRSDHAVSVELINTDPDRQAKVTVNLSGFDPSDMGEAAIVSSREYYENPITRRVQWSTGPRIERLKTGADFGVTLAPFSMTYVRIPDKARPRLSKMAQELLAVHLPAAGAPELRFIMPAKVYAGEQVSGDIIALSAGSQLPYRGALSPATLTADGNAAFDRSQVRLNEAVGHFMLKPAIAGELTLTAQSGDAKTTYQVDVKSSVAHPVVLWDFSNPVVTDKDTFLSDFALAEDLTQRANRAVARVDLTPQTTLPDVKNPNKQLLVVTNFPAGNKLDKANIRGVIADAKTSPDFVCDDPNASVLVVMQSPANWWMKIGSIPLSGAHEWTSHQLEVTNEDYYKALPSAFKLIFILQTNKPAKGSVYFDHIGFMVR